MSRTARTIGLTCWAILGFNFILAAIVAGWQFSAEQMTFLLLLAGYLIVSIFIFPAILAIIYRSSFNYWWIWTALIGLWILGGVGNQLQGQVPGWLSLLGSLIFFGSWVALLVGAGVVLFQRDIALPLIGTLSLVFVWVATITWWVRGDLIAEMLGIMLGMPGTGDGIFWLAVLLSSIVCLLPIAIVGFCVTTVRAIRREIRGNTLPAVAPVQTESASTSNH